MKDGWLYSYFAESQSWVDETDLGDDVGHQHPMAGNWLERHSDPILMKVTYWSILHVCIWWSRNHMTPSGTAVCMCT
jgi:hypothetical protein